MFPTGVAVFLCLCADMVLSENVVNLAVIAPRNESRMFSIRHIKPVIQYAIEEFKHQSLLVGVNVSVRYGDSKCDSKEAPLKAFDFYMADKVNVFLGPICDYSLAPVSRYAPYWNLPVLSPGGFAHDFGADKLDEFPTLTRTGVTFNSLARSTISLFKHFNLTHAKVIYDQSGHSGITPKFCFLAASAIVYYSKVEKLEYSFHIYLPDVHDIDDMLKHEVGSLYSRCNALKDFVIFTQSTPFGYLQQTIQHTISPCKSNNCDQLYSVTLCP